MEFLNNISLWIGRIVAGGMFLAIVIFLGISVVKFFKNPRCPECNSRKKATGIVSGKKPVLHF